MKIALFDSNSLKFAGDMMKSWESQGHEVTYEYGYNPWLANNSDVVFIDLCDNNAVVATTGGHIGPDWIIPDGRKLVVRAIDIEVWTGLHRGVNWDKVSDVIFIAKHIEAQARKDIDFEAHGVAVHHIPCGVDLARFSLRRQPDNTRKIAFVAELWHAKGVDLMLEIAKLLPQGYEINVLGKWALESWHREWVEYFVRQHQLPVTFEERVEDMSAWLEDKTYTLTCSKKEAFSYAIAEGMAKGLKPLVFDFQGSRDIWPEEYIYATAGEAVAKITQEPYAPHEYVDYVSRTYSLTGMMEEINKVCGIA